MKKFKNDVELSKTSTLSNASTVSYVNTRSPAINLPKINILNFKSDPNIFKSFLSGEAYKIVSELVLTENNYDHSLDLQKKNMVKQIF